MIRLIHDHSGNICDGWCVAYWWLGHCFYWLWLVILHKLGVKFLFRVVDCTQEKSDWVAATYCVLSFIKIFWEAFEVLLFYVPHPFMIEIFYELPDLSFSIKRLEIKMSTPVTKITWNDEYCVLVVKVRS